MNKINKSQIKDLANLYDIKTLSQAITDKGWACLCKEGNFLSKNDAPTLYNDMVEKYNNADTGATSLTSGFSKDNHELTCLSYINNKLYFIDESNDSVFYSNSYLSDGSAIQVNDISNARNMFAGNNCLIVVCDSGNSNKILKINPTDNSVIELGTHDTDYEGVFKLVGNKIYFFPFYQGVAQYTKVYEFVDDATDNTMVVRDYGAYVVDIEYYNGYYYLISVNTNVIYILKGLSLDNLNLADSSKWELLVTLTDGDFNKSYAQLFFVNNMCIMFTSLSGIRGKAYYCYDISSFTLLYSSIRELYGMTSTVWFVNNTFYFWEQWNLDARPEFKYCLANDILDYTNWASDSEISALNIDGYFSTLIQPTLQLFGLKVGSRKIYSRGIVKTTYTDTYVIDGTSVSVNYYLHSASQIKIVTEFSQITPMQIIGNYFGYCNYFFLSQAIGYQGVNLPYNSNLWTMIYVGDDYQETNLPTGNSIPFALKTDLDILPDQSGQSGKYLTTDGSTLSWAEVQGGGGTSIISTINTAVAPDTTSVNTGTDLSDDTILGVYINGLYQIDSSDYTMSTSGGESTIELATTYSTTVALNVVYATSVDIADLSYNDLSNKPSINGVTLSGDISLSSLGIQSQNLSFMNIEASTWSVSEAYPDYAYECSLPCTGVTTNSFAQVIFSPEDAASGNYANICATSTDSVIIYGKVDTTITIPTIIVMGV